MIQSLRLKPERSLTAALALILILGACTTGSDPATTDRVSTTTPVPTATDPDPCPDRFCVVYHIRTEASWSDGAPVSAADFVHTYQLQESSEGYQLISGHTVIDDKTVLFAFAEPYGPWQSLFDVMVPAHVEDPLSVSAGAFLLVELGEEVVLVRNPKYWSGDLEKIRFVRVDSLRDGLRRIESGDVDVMHLPALDWVVAEIDAMDGVKLAVGPGPVWEHLDFNLDDPLLSQQWLRDVVNLAIDREPILDETVRGVLPVANVLNSAVYPENSNNYFPPAVQPPNPDLALQILVQQGCQMGDDGVFVCGGVRMSFTYATTVGDPWRRAQFNFIRAALAAVGIELVGEFLTPAELFADDFLFGGPDQWQMISFPWTASADPHLGDSRFFCEGTAPNGFGALNVNRFCDPEIEDLIRTAQTEIDPERRVELYSQADLAYLVQMPIIPMYQRPVLMAWKAAIGGPELNISGSTDLWNIGVWTGASEVTIGIDRVPASLDPLAPGDAALILAPLTAGAYGIDPSLRFVPVLIERAETIASES